MGFLIQISFYSFSVEITQEIVDVFSVNFEQSSLHTLV